MILIICLISEREREGGREGGRESTATNSNTLRASPCPPNFTLSILNQTDLEFVDVWSVHVIPETQTEVITRWEDGAVELGYMSVLDTTTTSGRLDVKVRA